MKTLRERGVKIEKGEEYKWLAYNIGSKAKNVKHTDVCAIVTKGEQGFTVVCRNGDKKHHEIVKSINVVKTTGAGDTFTGTFCSMLLKGVDLNQSLAYAAVASKMTV